MPSKVFVECGLSALRRESAVRGLVLLVVPEGREPEPALLGEADWVAVPRGSSARVSAVSLAGQLALSLVALAS